MKKVNTTILFLILCLAAYSQQADVEGTIRSSDALPRIELYDNATSEDRIEFQARESNNIIYLESLRGDLRLGASTDGSNSTLVTLDASTENIGIGTITPDYELEVQNQDLPALSMGVDGTNLTYVDGVGEAAKISNLLGVMEIRNLREAIGPTAVTFQINTKDQSNVSGTRFSTDGAGQVGIGHDANLSASTIDLRHRLASGAFTPPMAGVRFTNSEGGNLNSWVFYVQNSDGELKLYSKQQGNFAIGTFDPMTGAYSSSSDIRLKSDITAMNPMLDKVKQLRPVSYFYKKAVDKTTKTTGFIAQELLDVFPQYVSYAEESDTYGIDYAGLSTIAIKAIQEQQNLIESQQTQLDKQQAEIDELRAMILELKN